jgi:hypothetical protein
MYTPLAITPEMIARYEPTRLAIKELAGKLYFCKSTKQDFIKYVGSGVYWLRRVKKYGRENVKTLWISDWYHCPYELQEVALHFSKENQIVESSKWANMKPENGIDGNTSGFATVLNNRPGRKEKQREEFSGINNPRYDPTEYTFIHTDGRIETVTKLEFRKRHPEVKTGGLAGLLSGKYKSDHGWRLITTPIEDTGKAASGRLSIDKTIYTFYHSDGSIVTCTRKQLIDDHSLNPTHISSIINGHMVRHKGWSIIEPSNIEPVSTNNPNMDLNLYEFKNEITGEIVISTRFDLQKTRGVKSSQIGLVLRGERNSVKGWKVVRKIISE